MRNVIGGAAVITAIVAMHVCAEEQKLASHNSENADLQRLPRLVEETSHACATNAGLPTVSCRANQHTDAAPWIQPYLDRVGYKSDETGETVSPIPSTFRPWWEAHLSQAQPANEFSIGVNWLLRSALQHSPRVQAVATEPHIQNSLLIEEHAAFDWLAFLDSTYDDLNDPVGNTLTTGNNDDRFKDRVWYANGGFRRRNQNGGELEIAQRIGHQSNNSRFLFPNPQGTARLELSYTQPLLNGAGAPYNESQILLARINLYASGDDVATSLEDHLLKVTRAYWALYESRAALVQRLRLMREAEKIASHLTARANVDSLRRQILRAKAAVANRRSEISRARTAIRNAESEIRLLVNDPALLASNGMRFSPNESPLVDFIPISMQDCLTSALLNRPDISLAIRSMRSTSLRLGIAKNEILPKLDLLVSTYVAGLEGDSRIDSAFGNQFADGRPGVSVGLRFEMPVGNRAPRARLQRRQWEMKRAIFEFQTVVEEALTSVEVAVREVSTSYQEMVGKYESMLASTDETEYLGDRWLNLPSENDSAVLLLENLLDAQERRSDEEAAFVQSQVNYVMSLVELRKQTGRLLQITPCAPRPVPIVTRSQTVSDYAGNKSTQPGESPVDASEDSDSTFISRDGQQTAERYAPTSPATTSRIDERQSERRILFAPPSGAPSFGMLDGVDDAREARRGGRRYRGNR